jgi:hypothetical protein
VKYQIRLLRVTGRNQEVISHSYAYQLLSHYDISMDSIFKCKNPYSNSARKRSVAQTFDCI